MFLNRNPLWLLLLVCVFVVCGCSSAITPEEKKALMQKELGIKSEMELDYGKLDHLVFLHKYANEVDKKFAHDAVELAKELMEGGNNLFPRVEYEEAISTYPTPEVVLAFADGYLRMAQYYINKAEPNLSTPLGNRDQKWYLEASAYFYQLTLDFTDKIGERITAQKVKSIRATIQCIHNILSSGNAKIQQSCELIGS